MEPPDKSQTIAAVCAAIRHETLDHAATLVRGQYPFLNPTVVTRTYTELEATSLFIRDGFIDRYSGQRLVFTPVLRLISRLLPADFPFHPNWKMSACHIAYYELAPTIDHVIPIARGGSDGQTNWVTTSMLRNNAKANWTLAELGWILMPAGDFHQWDGLIHWFLGYVADHPELVQETYFRRWHAALKRALALIEA